MLFFKKKSKQSAKLLEKWTKRHEGLQAKLWNKHNDALISFLEKPKQLAVSSLAGLLLVASPVIQAKATTAIAKEKPYTDLDSATQFILDLAQYVPKDVRTLTPTEEAKIAEVLSNHVKFTVTPQVQGKRLNRSYGLIGQEQHLARFPTDTIDSHFDSQNDAINYASYGMAPGLGAWGYFTTNGTFTKDDNLREKYYIAVQTFLAPGYNEHVALYNQFFKWRKMLVVNPQNGRALVADIGDAGPSEWTGKQLGGSPEVMRYLQRVDGADKGPVLYFFVDDPQNTVPLGPVAL